MAAKLGLPLEYRKFPQYFDEWNTSDETHFKNSLIEKILKERDVQTVLDLTCGTGSQVFFLKERGYAVTGADFSPDLLVQARDRAKRENIDVTFIDGDMRTLKVGTFDAVITIFNAVGHVTKKGFERTLKNIHRNLKKGGIYVFDIFNLNAMTDEAIQNLACYVHKKVGDTQILSTQCSTIDREKGLLTSYDTYLIQKGAEPPKRYHHKFSLQIYSTQELRTLLEKNGFEVLSHSSLEGEDFAEDKSLNILTVARKK